MSLTPPPDLFTDDGEGGLFGTPESPNSTVPSPEGSSGSQDGTSGGLFVSESDRLDIGQRSGSAGSNSQIVQAETTEKSEGGSGEVQADASQTEQDSELSEYLVRQLVQEEDEDKLGMTAANIAVVTEEVGEGGGALG